MDSRWSIAEAFRESKYRKWRMDSQVASCLGRSRDSGSTLCCSLVHIIVQLHLQPTQCLQAITLLCYMLHIWIEPMLLCRVHIYTYIHVFDGFAVI